MSENSNGKERRIAIQTIVDPKTLPTLIPVLLAVGSAFMVHDRSINTLQVTVAQHQQLIGSNSGRADTIRDIQSRLSILENQIQNVQGDDSNLYAEIRALEKEVSALANNVRYNDRQIADLLQRMKAVEERFRSHK